MNDTITFWQEPAIQSVLTRLFWLVVGPIWAYGCMRFMGSFLYKQHGKSIKNQMELMEQSPLAVALYRSIIYGALMIALALYLGAIIR